MSPSNPRLASSSLLALCPIALLACGAPDPTAEESEAGASATAANTLVVNANQVLRPVTHVATGSLYGLANATQPSDALVQAIKPNTFVQMPSGGRQQPDGNILVVAPTAARAGARLVNRLSDYYPGWPYQFSWGTWTPFITSQIAAMKSSPYYANIAAYELWNESDNTWQAANGTYEAFWTTTFRQVRSLDPTKPIQGPSFSDNISSMRTFLTNAVQTNTVPDIMAWHELTRASKIAGDVSTVAQIMRDLGISSRPIAIEEYAAPAEVGLPGPLVGYVAKFERLGIQDAELAFWNQSGTLGDLLTSKGGSPNAAYWMYTWYAQMSGNMVVTTPPAQTGIDGFAAVPAGNNQVSIVVGGCSGDCAVTVNGLNALSLGATVNVKVEQTVSQGRTVASSGPSTISTTTYTPSNGTISVPINMATNNAYRITITGSGTGLALAVARSGSGTGTVTSSSGGINCGSTCTATYGSGTAVTLTATAASGSTFTGWSGDCVGTGTCVVTMTAARSVTATFGVQQQGGPISINAGGGASGTFVADVNFSGGSTYSVTTTVDTSRLASPVPAQAVLQSERYGEFTYTIPGLNAGAQYTVTLWFDEVYWTAAGQRTFNVAINGATVLTAFDIFAAAGGTAKAIAQSFTTTANGSGQVVIQFTKGGGPDNPKVCGIAVAPSSGTTYALAVTKSGAGTGTVAGGVINCGSTCSATLASGTTVTLTATPASGSTFAGWSGDCTGTGACIVSMTAARSVTAAFDVQQQGGGISINAGGAASGTFVADANFSGGSTYSVTTTVDTSQLSGVIPAQAVLQTERYGEFTYTIPGLTAGAAYSVTLYFDEVYWTAAGQRTFNVAINGANVLTAFDIFAAAGATARAVSRTFDATANANGQIAIAFTKGGGPDNPKVCGIAVVPGGGGTTYGLAVTKAGTGSGTVAGGPINCGATCSAAVASGTAVTLTATPATGSTFAGWSGDCGGTGACVLSMTAARSVTATFNAVIAVDPTVSVNAGGAATGSFVADAYFSGGSTYSTTNAIDTSQITSGPVPPQAVFQSERYGEFTYTIASRTPGSAQTVTLYFQESYWTAAGQRTFNVAVNGATVLTAFDIFAQAGGANRAIARTFNTTANASGQVVIQLTRAGGPDNPKLCGITVTGG